MLPAEVNLGALPAREALLAGNAFSVADDVTDRDPIIRHNSRSGPGAGFVDAGGQPDFLPAGPWLVCGNTHPQRSLFFPCPVVFLAAGDYAQLERVAPSSTGAT